MFKLLPVVVCLLLSSLCACSESAQSENTDSSLLDATESMGAEEDKGAEEERASEMAPEVAVVVVAAKSHVLKKQLAGRTSAYRVSEVRPQVNGIVQARLFEEGALVEAGQALYRIDDEQYQARLAQANADLALSQAALVSVQSNLKRYQKLINNNGISEQDLETAQAEYQQGLARVQAAKAMLKTAQIDLQRTLISAPISGRIGRSNISEGALVSVAQEAPLATIQQLDPIYVDIVQSSQQIIQLKRLRVTGALKPASDNVSLMLEDGLSYAHQGSLKFSGVNVDERTGAVTLRAQFPNPEGMLLPGMYVRAQVQQGVQENVMMIPQQAVSHNPHGEPVAWVVDEKNQVQERVLELIGSESSQWIVNGGLVAGERLIVEGLQRAHPGAKVSPVEWVGDSEQQDAFKMTVVSE